MQKNKSLLWLALIVPIGFLLGTYLGIQFSVSPNSTFTLPNFKQDRVSAVIDYVDKMYVDDVERDRLIEVAIQAITKELDPHSTYLNPEEMALMQEPMQGHFYGIGVEFLIINDTINVLKTVANGPSEKAGLQQGDKILYADGKKLFGDSINNADVLKTLKGAENTKVEVSVWRNNDSLSYTITRGSIPIPSVVGLNVLKDTLGFIKILRFADGTDTQFFTELNKAIDKNIDDIIIDLRDNGGGYLSSTIAICEQLLDKGELIVYTEGKARPRKNYYAKGNSRYKNLKFYVLINENSASASEILSGAFQDNDRAVIFGERSFGKGLVQEERNLPQNAAIRLTVARYYTPSGRSIQKVYQDSLGKMINREDYYSSKATAAEDSTVFLTKSGRKVYAGGGISPDVKIDAEKIDSVIFSNDGNTFSSAMENIYPLIAYGAINVECYKYIAANNFDFGKPTEFNNDFNLEALLKFIDKNNPDLKIVTQAKKYNSYDISYFKAVCARYLYNASQAQMFTLNIDNDIKYLLNYFEVHKNENVLLP